MATNFQQTNSNANGSALADLCSGNTSSSDKDSNQADVGGAAGSTERTHTPDNSAADLNGVWMEIGNGVSIDLYDGAAGNWTWRINITSSNHQLTLDEVHICRVNSSYVNQETLGSSVGIAANLGATGVQSGVINQGAGTTIAAGDKIIIIFAFDNAQSMANSLGYTPDQIIDAPGTVVGGETHDGAAVLSGTATLTAAGAMVHCSAAVLSGTATITPSGAMVYAGGSALSGTATLAAANQVIRDVAAALSGTATLAGVNQVIRDGAAVISGTATLTAAGAMTYAGVAPLSGTATLTATANVLGTGTTHNGAAVLSGTATLAAQGQRMHAGAAVLSGTATLAAIGEKLIGGQAVLSGTATLAAVAAMDWAGVSALSGTAILTAVVEPPPEVPGGGLPPGKLPTHKFKPVLDPPKIEAEFKERWPERKQAERSRVSEAIKQGALAMAAQQAADIQAVDAKLAAEAQGITEARQKKLARKRQGMINLEAAKRAIAEKQARQDDINKKRAKSLKKARAAKKRKARKKK